MIQPSFQWSSGKPEGEKRVSAATDTSVCSDGGSTSWGLCSVSCHAVHWLSMADSGVGEGVVSGVEHGVTIGVMQKTAQEYPRVVETPQVARPSRDTGATQKTEHHLEKDETDHASRRGVSV